MHLFINCRKKKLGPHYTCQKRVLIAFICMTDCFQFIEPLSLPDFVETQLLIFFWRFSCLICSHWIQLMVLIPNTEFEFKKLQAASKHTLLLIKIIRCTNSWWNQSNLLTFNCPLNYKPINDQECKWGTLL